jgi:hypothetical protein
LNINSIKKKQQQTNKTHLPALSQTTNNFKMQFKTLFAASLLSGFSAAAPAASEDANNCGKPFQLMALRSGSKVHFAPFSAAHAGLLLNLPDGAQGADCGPGGSDPNNRATFRINNEGELLLNSVGLIQQRFYTDRSGMGEFT